MHSITLSGLLVDAAISVIEIDDVLDARIVSGLHIWSSSEKSQFLEREFLEPLDHQVHIRTNISGC